MSNYLAVATVTAALRRMLQAAVGQDVSGATVSTVRPDVGGGLPEGCGVNVFLYHAAPNPDWRNRDLPTRRSDGSLAQFPEAALDLHYLLSFYGEDGQLGTHRLLGSTVRTLHARPILSRQLIEETLSDPSFGFLAGSDLAEQVEHVRLIPLGLTSEELATLWNGLFNQSQYLLSLAYRASVVLLTAEDQRPAPALPVRQRQLLVQPFRQPQVERVESAGGPVVPLVVGSEVRVLGERLRGDHTRLRLAGQELVPDPAQVSDREIRFVLGAPALNPGELRAGVLPLQVLHPFLLGSPPAERAGVESAAAPLVLHPRLHDVRVTHVVGQGTINANVTLKVEPPVGQRQRVTLLLNSFPGNEPVRAYTFHGPKLAGDTATLSVPITGVQAGAYLVRLQVDGAESSLTPDENPTSPTYGQFFGPLVQIGTP